MMNALPAPTPAGAPGTAGLPAAYRELLALTDGPSRGDVTVFPAALVPRMQTARQSRPTGLTLAGREKNHRTRLHCLR